MNKLKLLLLAILVTLASPVLGEVGYTSPDAHYCTGRSSIDGSWNPMGKINRAATPEEDLTWYFKRYSPYFLTGAPGMHSTDFQAALQVVYDGEPSLVEIYDAYCTQDPVLLDRSKAINISGNTTTPYEPGFFRGRMGWTLEQWRAFVQYNAHLIVRDKTLGTAYLEVLKTQLGQIENACYGDKTGPATLPSMGAWKATRPGYCKATTLRWGKPDPIWTLGIDLSVEPAKGGGGYRPGRLSTSWAETTLGK